MSYINTYTEKMVNPMEPDMDAIDIRDIAHSLSLTCRGNGHVKTFFSVGQHCINCALEAEARGHSKRVILGCLLHDGSEAYMSDVPRPFKAVLEEYRKAEDTLIDLIYTKFLGSTLDEEEAKLVKQIDDDMLYYDLKVLLHVDCDMEPPKLGITLDYTVVPFEQVEKQYLDLFYKWI